MSDTTTRTGVDVTIDVTPDTPANAERLARALSLLDRLASELNTIDPDWAIEFTVGGSSPIYVSAEPTLEQDHQ